MPVTVIEVLGAVENSTSFNGFRQHIMHLQDKLTDTDIAIHARKQARKQLKEDPKNGYFDFKKHKDSLKDKTYEEFLAVMEAE